MNIKQFQSENSRRSIPLRLILIAPFVVQIFAAVSLVGYLSYRNGQKAVNDVASQLRSEIGDRIKVELDKFTSTPYLVGQITMADINQGKLKLNNSMSMEKHLWHQLFLFKNLTFNSYGNERGEYIGPHRDPRTGILRISISNPSNHNIVHVYNTDNAGNRTGIYQADKKLYPQNRIWYKEAKVKGKPTWNSIYSYVSYKTWGASMCLPIYNKNGGFHGVLLISISLSQISNFLHRLKIGHTGQAFIIERDGNLVATSNLEQPYILGKKSQILRLAATHSQDALVKTTANYLQNHYPDFHEINSPQELSFLLAGEKQFIKVIPLQDSRGLDWLIVVIVPESDFMAQINANTRTTIFLCLGALVLATFIGIYTSRWITQPIVGLNQASMAIADGDLNQRIETSSVDELAALAASFNRMAQKLQDSFQSLAQINSQLELRVAERTVELVEAKRKADSANHAKSEFLANMSHELRTPLNGILGYAQILERSKVLPEEERHGVKIIHQCGSHLLSLINDVLDISKIEARKLELTPESIYLPALLQGVVEISQIRAQQKNITFYYEPDANLPSGVITDEKRLRQVLINLLGNAIKFTDKGSVTFQIRQLELNHHQFSSASLRFLVKDTGVGISNQDIQKLFQAFEQVGEHQRQAEGTGLGLAISQQIVQFMGGKIQVQSQLGIGSEFYFDLELPLVTDWIQQQTSVTERIIGYVGAQRRILVVDDRWENRSVIVNLLAPLGFVVIEAIDGQDGLDKMRAQLPDLVITDLSMPIMNGFEMLNQLRDDSNLKQLKVIVSSASVSQLDQRMSLNAGADDFLAKPIQSQDLFHILTSHLQLTWQYEEMVVSPAISVEFIVPDSVDLKLLLELVQEGRLKKLVEMAEQIEQKDQRYQPFIQQILQFVKLYQSEMIEELIQQYLTINKH